MANAEVLNRTSGVPRSRRRFIKDFSAVASPLFQLLKKDTRWEWTEERQKAFDALKSRLLQEPILALPANEGQYILDTVASDFALGAVLSQVQNEEEKVIAYSSRTLSASEKKYEVTRKELLGICHKGRLEPTNLNDTLQVRTY